MIYTYVTLALDETILGEPDAEPIVIRTWGGDVAEGGCFVSDQPHFVAGELVLVFLEHDSTASRYYKVTGAFQGKFTIDGGWIVEKGVSLSAFVDQITGRTPAESPAPEAPPLTAAEGPRYSYPGYKWPESSMPIRYSINENGLDDCTFDEFKAIQRAGQVWEQVPGAYFSLCYAGTTSTNVQAQDGENVVAFVSMGANELGWGNVWYDADDWIYEADIRINKDKSWSAFSGNACSADRYDVQSLAAHEFGHWLYLGHSSDEDATMSVGLGKGEIWPRDLAADDMSASRGLYPHYDGRPHVQPGCWWWAPASPMMFSSLGIADFDRDGTDELIVGFGGGAAGVWALNGDGSCVRTNGIGTGQIVGSVPAVVELDGDMWLEVVVGSADNKVYVKNDDGTNVAGWPIATGGEVHSSPALGDIDGDGALEIVIGSDDGKVYAWNANGTVLDRDAAAPWDWPKTVGDKVQSSPALGDADGNSGLDFVVVGSDDGNVYAWDYTGTALAGWPKGTGDKVRSSPAIGDIDDDDELEVIVGSDDGNVYAWNLDGTVVDRDGAAPWDWPNATGGAVSSSPALGDIDGDGDLDVVVGSADGKVYAWDHTGTTLTGWPVTTAESVLCSPIIGDMDGDNQQEVIVGSNDGRVHAWNGNGTVVTGWPSSIVDDITASPALGDIDDNGELELCVAIGGFLGYGVGCWDLGSPYNEDRLAWPVFGHDRYHTSNAGCHLPEITEMVHLEDFNPDRGDQDWGSGSQGCPLPGYDGSTSVSPPFSWGVAGSSMAGAFAWSQSENVQIDFAQPYEV
ncbi:MAG: VCBS repeat-containing protein, partial [Phycisphaerae bacterium]|nr:VCBS repeat-containing protein [Phycisphaerae bacterium]